MLQSGQTKVCVKSSRVEVADISSLRNNHHEEAKGNRDRGVTQSLLASTDSRQGEDSSTVSVSLLKVMSESQVENGLVEQCSQSAHSNCTASRTNCTVSESNAKPQKKSANPEVDVMYKTKFKINNISGGKFDLKLSRNLVLENEGGGKSEILRPKEKIGHTTDIYLVNKTHSENFASNKFRGGKVGRNNKHFNNIPITTTPTKRKMEESEIGGAVKTLIDVFNRTSCSAQPECGTAGSPAKRRRWGHWGEGH